MKEAGESFIIRSHDAKIIRPCEHVVQIPYEAFADKVEVPCIGTERRTEKCDKKYMVEVIDRQGVLYVQWWQEGDAPGTGLVAEVTSLIERYGLPAVHAEVRRRDGFCGNCGVPLTAGTRHVPWGSMGSCSIEVTDPPANPKPGPVILECDRCHQRDEYPSNLEWQECTNCRIPLSTADRKVEVEGGENNG